ncbi:MAG: tRNA (guanosine(46)-N7)-methyltransferase TrmB [Kiritimatiellae bacterium]|nr:tRNA (guanosine(46)-N7)-methyltransferase TrmB [Kiritimatiellia bacterium]MDD4734725.1 tRNA (guanosine(46)-N7)-methyltransferase TrmB [Kiritimatiellia bacterium]
MKTDQPHSASVRFIPDQWLYPFSVSDLFSDERPLEVDVGCGKGRFLLEHAAAHPDVHFLGVDRMLRRIRKIDKKAVRRQLTNIRLLRMDACYTVTHLIPSNSVSTYYLFFPDPWPKKKHHDNRLFDPPFLDAMADTFLPGGSLNFATDHLPYFEEVRDLLRRDARFEEATPYEPPPQEKSDFELLFMDRPIGRCSFKKRD